MKKSDKKERGTEIILHIDKKDSLEKNESKEKKEEKQKGQSQEQKKSEKNKEQEVGLSDKYAAEVDSKIQDDKRLDSRASYVLAKMQEQEENIQKQLLKMNVSKQGALNHGQKNW